MTQFNTSIYDIERPTGQCAFTGRTLEVGEPYIATLVETDLEPAPGTAPGTPPETAGLGMKRLDVSLEAWQEGQRPQRLFSHWKSIVPEPNEKKKLFVDDEVLMNLFRRLEETQDAQRLAFRFVLGLILMRKKLLRYDGASTQGEGEAAREVWQMTPKGGEEPLDLVNPQLDEAKIEQVTTQLSEILEAEL